MNKLVFKYLGWFFYPIKQGKENRYQKLEKIYGKK